MKNPKKLRRRHKEFLSTQGIMHKDYLFISEDATNYKFFNRKTEKIVDIRR
ncbi:hypothetical protein NNC19_07375 [Clostridium sp. SHJSY1]|uniref:DUF6906 family protein n=1 Tax=Clostridium sp. SHJSY1 TaxID=2942483 RepID=UPI0028770F3F|nr:hypothetical protein [Clostridium sp. SHJSY1]MDS0525495.1 hypothetical protein [Clostridium sp. SHJSY1]